MIRVLAQCITAISVVGLLSSAAASQQPNMVESKYVKYAESLIAHYDKDKDGKLSQGETKKMRRPPVGADANKDGFVTEAELIDSVSRTKKSSNDNQKKNAGPKTPKSNAPSTNSSQQSKYKKYAEAYIRQYDSDKDGTLSKDEVKQMRRPPIGADANKDGFITEAEMIGSLSGRKSSSSGIPLSDVSNLSQARSLLRANGISPDSSSVLAYLKRQLPSDNMRSEIAKLIRQLSHESFDLRTEASAKLATFGVAAKSQLQVAAQTRNPEVVCRARKILHQIDSSADISLRNSLMLAALHVLKDEPTPDAVPVLLAIEETLSRPYVDDLVKEAIWASTNPSHAELLTTTLEHENVRVQCSAIVALEIALGKNALPSIQPRLTNKHPGIRLAAARATVDHDPQEAIRVLHELLSSDTPEITWKANSLLQAITGHRIELSEKGTLAKNWTKWIEKNPTTADPKTPLGKARLSFAASSDMFREQFSLDAASITKGYGRFAFEGAPQHGGRVHTGVLRLTGNHSEADQRLVLRSRQLTGHATWPSKFELQVRVGGDASRTGAYHVGVSVGKVKILFHPGYRGGAFRIEHVDTHLFLTSNEVMPFQPQGGVLYPMTIKVEKVKDGARFDIKIEPPVGSKSKAFTTQYVASNEQLGRFDRIGLERSGRQGGDALFDSVEIRLSR